MNPTDILHPKQREPSKCYLVNKLRDAVFSWRQQGYPGATETSKRLLQFWFEEDHLIEKNEPFQFWFCQREAIETLIYIYEVLKKRKFIEMAQEFGSGPIGMYHPEFDKYPLYAFKMATGSGKTFVMAFAIIWSYFNYIKESKQEYTSKFLLIAPNVIVYERLKRDFEDGKIFKQYPFIPDEWKQDFDLKVILREDPINIIPENVLFLTNIQQLQEREKQDIEIEDILELGEAVLKDKLKEENRIKQVILACPNLMILKDEAHHIYHVEKAWKKILLNLHEGLKNTQGFGINMELDFSATPKTETGAFFPWIIVDFSLKEAIEMNILKRPLKGKVGRAKEIASTKAHEKYRAWIDAGVRRWRDYKQKLQKLNKRPILFIMCENTDAANDVYDYLNSITDLKGKVLLIHTNLQGEVIGGVSDILKDIPQKELINKVREIAKNIDEPDPKKNPYEAIVSVLMLNEGWDVRNVTIVVGLRSYTSKRKVLPEQVIGRGLRKMFPDQPAGNARNLINMLEVIGPPGLTNILEKLEQEEKIKFDTFDVSEPINITTILVDENKLKFDFSIPIISPRIERKQLDINKVNLSSFEKGNFELGNKVIKTPYIAEDMIKKVIVIEKQWTLPVPQDTNSVISYYTQKILKELKLPITTNFSLLYPIVKKYVQDRLFKNKVKLDDPRVLYVLSEPETEEFILKLFIDNLRNLTFKTEKPRLIENRAIKNTEPFPWSRQVYPANKTVFNYIPCENELEVKFAKFLDSANDIISFVKIVPRIGFFIEYISSSGQLRLYYPDFIVLTKKKEYFLIETKGLVDVDVPKKDERAKQWCQDVTKLTGKKWNFIRIDQNIFLERHYSKFYELIKSIQTAKRTKSGRKEC
jgi:type III restriction enzyme